MVRFEDKGGFVIDHKTCLEWSDVAGQMSLCEADEYADSLGDGWRLPTIEELETLIDRSKANPASPFPGMTSECFWSSSSYAGDSYYAWYVDFYNGSVNSYDKTGSNYVRCVRSGTPSLLSRIVGS